MSPIGSAALYALTQLGADEAIAALTGRIPGARDIEFGNIAAGRLPPQPTDRRKRVFTVCQGGPIGQSPRANCRNAHGLV